MHILMAMIPGPNTVVVTYFSARTSRQAGLKAVAGIVLGSAIWVILSMLGVGVLLVEAGTLYNALRLLGAVYLIYVGVKMLISGTQPSAEQRLAQASGSPMLAGLLTTLSNPKSAVFWTSVFVVVVPAHAPPWFYGAVVLLIVVQSALWYAIVALALSTAFRPPPLHAFRPMARPHRRHRHDRPRPQARKRTARRSLRTLSLR